MKGLTKRGSIDEINKGLLEFLKEFENWTVIGWHHMNAEKYQWFGEGKRQKLSKSRIYKTIKQLMNPDLVVPLRKTMDGNVVRYVMSQPKSIAGAELPPELQEPQQIIPFIESIFFSVWLLKRENVCVISYGTHKFSNETFNRALGGAGYSISYKKLKDLFVIFAREAKK